MADELADPHFEAVQAALLERWPESRIGPGLERVTDLLDMLGEPQRTMPAIHIAGTNGKTSTARIVESLLRAFGLRTGLFTSPHLHSITERIRVDGAPVSHERFVEAYEDIAPLLALADERSQERGGPRLTFFETMTCLAYAIFADAPVDVMVVEVGIGGTHDATNVIEAEVSVVTQIDFDHMHILGNTLEEIAGNKAGIIKSGSTAVLTAQQVEAAQVLLARCAEVGAMPLRESIEFAVLERLPAIGGQQLTLRGRFGEYEEVFLPLIGAHQAHNAAAALVAVESFLGGALAQDRGPLDIDAVREGFAAVTSPGRLEVVRREPTVIVDAAHNPAGAAALAAGISEAYSFGHLIGVIAALGDKDTESMFAHWVDLFDEVIITRNESARAQDPDALAQQARSQFEPERVSVAADLVTALESAVARADIAREQLGGGVGIVVTGSVVTAGQARALLGKTLT
jgi:dihydrofolate synthase/folylpolyglutamate synthase